MLVSIEIDEVDADEILTAISYRCKQDGIVGTEKCNELIELGTNLSRTFEKTFKWKEFNGKPRKVFEFLLEKKIKVRVRG